MKEIHLKTPLSEADVRSLQVGDLVLLSGVIVTARDAVHKYLVEGGDAPEALRGGVVYHCGPIVVQTQSEDGRKEWAVRAAGPTTSSREEHYEAEVIRMFGIRAIIGKGGMGARTLQACQQEGCVYLHTIGGAAQVLADCIQRVRGVSLLEKFGSPEAMWEFEVDNFPAFVTMDAHGNSLHATVYQKSEHVLQSLFEE